MTWQTALWDFVNASGRWWDVVIGLIALGAGLTLYLRLLLHERFGAVFLARALIAAGLVATVFIPLNSGWTKIALAFLVLGCTFSTILTVNGLTRHPVKLSTVAGMFGGWVYRQIAVVFVLGEQRRTGRG